MNAKLAGGTRVGARGRVKAIEPEVLWTGKVGDSTD